MPEYKASAERTMGIIVEESGNGGAEKGGRRSKAR